MLVSLMLFGVRRWSSQPWSRGDVRGSVSDVRARLFKANLWEVLAIIGVAQVLILPVIAAGAGPRARWRRFCWPTSRSLLHVQLRLRLRCPNWFDAWLGTAARGVGRRLLRPALVGGDHAGGPLAYDAVMAAPAGGPRPRRAGAVGAWVDGRGLCVIAACRCSTTASRPPDPANSRRLALLRCSIHRASGRSLSPRAFWPSRRWCSRPRPSAGRINYWMMNKKITSLPFVLFATGFAIGALWFVRPGVRRRARCGIGLFRTFGQNCAGRVCDPPAWSRRQIHTARPQGRSPGGLPGRDWRCSSRSRYLFVRYLEKQGVHHPAMTSAETLAYVENRPLSPRRGGGP